MHLYVCASLIPLLMCGYVRSEESHLFTLGHLPLSLEHGIVHLIWLQRRHRAAALRPPAVLTVRLAQYRVWG